LVNTNVGTIFVEESSPDLRQPCRRRRCRFASPHSSPRCKTASMNAWSSRHGSSRLKAGTTRVFLLDSIVKEPWLRIPATRMRPGCAWTVRPRKKRAQGKPGGQCTRSLACEI